MQFQDTKTGKVVPTGYALVKDPNGQDIHRANDAGYVSNDTINPYHYASPATVTFGADGYEVQTYPINDAYKVEYVMLKPIAAAQAESKNYFLIAVVIGLAVVAFIYRKQIFSLIKK